MNTLIALQEKLQNHLFNGPHSIEQWIISTPTFSAEDRLAVYENAYCTRLIKALAIHYPKLCKFLGKKDFDHLAHAYLLQHPSSFQSIREFGNLLSDFLTQHPLYHKTPYLSELAHFEWAMSSVYDAPHNDSLTVATMKSIPPEAWSSLCFQMQASVYRLNLSWDVVTLWQTLSDDEILSTPIQTKNSCPWILWRQNLKSRFCLLSQEEAYALDSLIEGKSFGDVCEGLGSWFNEEEAALQAASFLKAWITAGLITHVITTQKGAHYV